MTITEYQKRLREHGCMITGRPNPQLHHCKGGSMVEVLPKALRPGVSQKASNWLQIPLDVEFHTGNNGIHQIGVKTWEAKYGSQASFLVGVSAYYGVDLIEKLTGEIV